MKKITCKVLEDKDMEKFLCMMREYLPDSEEKTVIEMRGKYRTAYVGCFEEEELIGIAYGFSRQEIDKKDTSFMLDGIALAWEEKAHGLGSKLLDFWEGQVRELGFHRASVGSAPGYPEHFYIKNGYIPIAYKAFDHKGKAHVKEIVSMEDYRMLDRQSLEMEADGNRGFVVLEHEL